LKNQKLIVGILVLVSFILAFRLLPIDRWLQVALDAYRGLGVWGAGLFIITYTILALLLVPGSILTLAAAALYGFLWGYVVVTVAALCAAALAFMLAKGLLREKVEDWAEGYPLFKAVSTAVARQGAFIALLVRLSPVFPFSITNYLFGLTRVRFSTYMLANWIGMAPGTFLYVYIGVLGTELAASRGDVGALRLVLLAVGLLATIAVTWLVTRLARKALRENTQLPDDNTP
jgi:uncharacterized membrane protein YdjX (TVP38/TMEM64 family)